MPQIAHLQWEGRRIFGSRFQRLVSEGIGRALEHTLGVATTLVPLDEGPLQRSGKVQVEGLNGTISFSTPYAVVQHENLSFRHAPGRTAKYLEGPMNTERDVMLDLSAVSFRTWLRG